MAYKQDNPIDVNEFNKNLIKWVQEGSWQVHVLDANRWESLPVELRKKYYPLFDRATTPYRMYPQYMKSRKTINPKRIPVSKEQLIPKMVELPAQYSKEAQRSLPVKAVVSTNPSTSDTELTQRTTAQIRRQAAQVGKGKAKGAVSTVFDRHA